MARYGELIRYIAPGSYVRVREGRHAPNMPEWMRYARVTEHVPEARGYYALHHNTARFGWSYGELECVSFWRYAYWRVVAWVLRHTGRA